MNKRDALLKKLTFNLLMLNSLEVRTVIKQPRVGSSKIKLSNVAFSLKIALWFDINNRHYKNTQEKLTERLTKIWLAIQKQCIGKTK